MQKYGDDEVGERRTVLYDAGHLSKKSLGCCMSVLDGHGRLCEPTVLGLECRSLRILAMRRH